VSKVEASAATLFSEIFTLAATPEVRLSTSMMSPALEMALSSR